ncbi:MAG: SH3 domain-containing protein [Pyrinomonadaceae bacterium]|nr:SH3 domain-containing protein [Pyrinomonadaceae bacterium]
MRLTFTFLLLLIITVLACSPVWAQQENRWIYVNKSSDGTLFYIDKNSRQKSGNNIRIWNKSIFWNGTFRLNLVEWNCREKKYLFVEILFYSQTGKFLRKESDTEWVNVIPDSISEGLHEAICGDSLKNNSKTKSSNRKTAQIIVKRANLRLEPNLSGNIVEEAKLGEEFLLADEQPTNGWYQVILFGNDKTAWIHGNNIKLVEFNNKSNTKKQRTKRQK